MLKRPALESMGGDNHPKKKVRHDQTKFTSVADIQACLRSQDVGVLAQGLTMLRDQWTIRGSEDIPGPQDERLLLVKSWLETYPAERDIFCILDRQDKSTASLMAVSLAVLSVVLDLLSSQYIYHSLGLPILKNLLSPVRMRQLNTNIGHKSFEVVLWTVKLLNSISNFAGGVEKRALMDGFEWGQKTIQNLLFQRRKITVRHGQTQACSLDIRTLFIDFLLSFLSPGIPTLIKLSLLEQHRDVFLLIFKGIYQDSYIVIRRILETCWDGIWNDNKIKRTLKVGLFNETTLNHLLRLYQRREPENDDGLIPADLVHQFMLAIMTRPGLGICFKNRGWYFKENTSDGLRLNEADVNTSEEDGRVKIYNKILANVIKALKLNEDPRQRDLAFHILQACPELVTSFWGAVKLTLEPRLASRWIINMSILGTIISFPIPLECFFIPNSSHLNPSPPTLGPILANILPPVLSKSYLTKGIQSSSSLLQHCTALTLSKCLVKFERVLRSFRETAAKLQERKENGQWLECVRELESEMEKRVPEFSVVVGMVQQKPTGSPSKQQAIKIALLTESGLRLLWLYYKLFPRLISNAKFDAGKLLLNVSHPSDITIEEESIEGTILMQRDNRGLDILRRLHVLRLLKESSQFGWLNKFGSSSHTNLYTILMLYSKATSKAVHQATAELLTHLLNSSIMFSHDSCEIELWLQSIPTVKRRPNAAAPDGTSLGDEAASVLTFLDDCIQRCSKTFYRYLEESVDFFHESQAEDNRLQTLCHNPQSFPSPLVMTIFEQLKAKLAGNLLTPSDTLAIVTFIRKLGISLVSKIPELRHLRKMHARLQDILSFSDIAPRSDVMQQSIRREGELMEHMLSFIDNPVPLLSTSTNPVVGDFLDRVESLSIPISMDDSICRAYELVDWARMVHVSLHPLQAKRVFEVILSHSSLAGRDFLYQLDPSSGQFWVCIEGHEDIILNLIPFELAHLHTAPQNMLAGAIRERLALSFVSGSSWNKLVERKASVMIHRLTSDDASIHQSELCLFIDIFERGFLEDSEAQLKILKRAIFSSSKVIKIACSSDGLSNSIIIGLAKLVELAMKPSEPDDHEILLPYSSYWAAACQANPHLSMCVGSLPWLPFIKSGILIKLLHAITTTEKDFSCKLNDLERKFVGAILKIFTARSPNDSLLLKELHSHVSGLLSLKKLLKEEASVVDSLVLLVLEARLPVGYYGLPIAHFISPTLVISYATSIAQVRWRSKSMKIACDDSFVIDLITSGHWSSTAAKIIGTMIYQSSNARRVFWTWFTSSDVSQHDDHDYLLPLYAYLDVTLMLEENDGAPIELPAIWVATLASCLLSPRSSDGTSSLCGQCIKLAYQICPSSRELYIKHLTREVKRNYPVRLPVIQLVCELRQIGISKSTELIDVVLSWVLKWMVDIFTGEELSAPFLTILEELNRFFDGVESKPHLIEPVMKVAIQNCLHMPSVLDSILPLLKSTHLKPAIVNRLLQNVVQDNQLYRATALSSPARKPVIRLLHSLFHLHPANTCQANHISPLLPLYNGTLSTVDKLLFSIFQLYERQRRETVASFLRNWSPSITSALSQNTLGAIISLDSNKVFRSCVRFPTRRSFIDDSEPTVDDESVYDPLFLALLTAQLLMEYKNLSTNEWVQIFRTNITSFLICLLTSRRAEIRRLGVVSLGGLSQRLQDAEFHEKNQVIYILDLLRDLLPWPALETKHFRLPTFSALLFAHALRSIFYPSSFLYPIVSRFLLQRPEFDLKDVPMLYSMLYSSEDGEWQKERAWILKFLTDVMNDGSTQDSFILKRRHTWDLLASIWQACKPEDRSLRKHILGLLANLSTNQHSVSFLLLRTSLLPWIEMQLLSKTANDHEYLAWAKIVENVIVAIDKGKIKEILQGEYTAIVLRCLRLILNSVSFHNAGHISAKISVFFLVIRSLLRITCLNTSMSCKAGIMLRDCTQILPKLETFIWYRGGNTPLGYQNASTFPEAPHRANTLFDEPGSRFDLDENIFSLIMWKKAVVMLWRAIMACNAPEIRANVHIWDIVTCRILVLGTMFDWRIDEQEDRIINWVRQQAMIDLVKWV